MYIFSFQYLKEYTDYPVLRVKCLDSRPTITIFVSIRGSTASLSLPLGLISILMY